VALNWLLHHSAADCIILGASRLQQLEENLKAMEEGPLPPEVLAACEEAWNGLRGVTPKYNR
jgi:aryl-alcohol dehydrogenase-like predicted oxidoreductase